MASQNTRIEKDIMHILVLFMAFLHQTSALGPPRANSASESPKIVQEGTTAVLPCSVQGDPENLYYEWYKEKEPLSVFGNQRFRTSSNGVLRVKDTCADDTGLYTCRVVNGFGSAEVNVTLIVLDQEDYKEWVEFESKSKGNNFLEKPSLLNGTETIGTLERQVGEMVKLKCLFSGRPTPSITWYKNGDPLPKVMYTPRRARWSLSLSNLQVSDSGNYTCYGRNVLGTASSNFQVIVADPKQSKPILSAIRPYNATVREGSSLTLVCVVKSHLLPHIQWLHHIKDTGEPDVILMMGEAYKVIKTSNVVERSDDMYLSKLSIQKVQMSHSGKYICLGANSMGYNYKSTYITVKSASQEAFMESNLMSFSSTLIITATLFVVAMGIGCLVYFLCQSTKKSSPLENSSSNQVVHPKEHSQNTPVNTKSVTDSLVPQNMWPPFTSLATPEQSVSSDHNSTCSCHIYSSIINTPSKPDIVRDDWSFPRRNPGVRNYNKDFNIDIV